MEVLETFFWLIAVLLMVSGVMLYQWRQRRRQRRENPETKITRAVWPK